MDYYVLLQSHIEEAHRAGLEEMLLIPANMEEMVHPLPNWEKRVWWERQSAGLCGICGGLFGVRHQHGSN